VKIKATFGEANILNPNGESLQQFNGKVHIIVVCLFLHLFGWDDQVIAMKKMVKFSMPGTMVVGRQTLVKGA